MYFSYYKNITYLLERISKAQCIIKETKDPLLIPEPVTVPSDISSNSYIIEIELRLQNKCMFTILDPICPVNIVFPSY